MKKINTAILGLGDVGIKHFDSLVYSKNYNLIAIAEKKSFIIKKKIKQNIKFYNNADELINSEKHNLDLVVICLPSWLHYKYIMKSIKNNLNVVCEKPLTLRSFEAKKIKKNLNGKKIKVFEVKQLRFLPLISHLKNNILNKTNLRCLKFINFNLFLKRNINYYKSTCWRGKIKLDGGALFNQFIHHLDLAIYLTKAKSISVVSYTFLKRNKIQTEELGSLILKINNKVLVNINFFLNNFKNNCLSSLNFLGTKFAISVNNNSYSKYHEVFFENKKIESNLKKMRFKNKDLFTAFYENVYKIIKKNKKNIKEILTLNDAIKQIKILEIAYKKSKNNEIL